MSKAKNKSKKNNQCICVLCGRSLSRHAPDIIVGSTGRVVCGNCIQTSKVIKDSSVSLDLSLTNGLMSQVIQPSYIMDELDKSIIGQHNAKRAVSIAMWKQLYHSETAEAFPKTNLLLFGPTGCGKTALVQKAAELVDLPFVHVDATTLTESGYKGREVRDIVKELNQRYKNHPRLKNSVVFIDELDKLASTKGNEYRAAYCRGTQHALLRFIEGEKVFVDSLFEEDVELSTEGFLFVFGGAFTGIKRHVVSAPHRSIGFLKEADETIVPIQKDLQPEDFISFGLEPELLGRIGQFVELLPLSTDDMTRILLDSELSAYVHYKRFFENKGVDLVLSAEEAHSIAEKAAAQKLGARSLNTLVEHLVEPMLFLFAEGKLKGTVALKMEADHELSSVG